MRLLLDTHTFLWYISDSPHVSESAREHIDNEHNQILLSAASVWEMAIKHSQGKLNLTMSFEVFVLLQLRMNDFRQLEIQKRHIDAVATLPFHHRDPFDRLLVSQAMVERIPILSANSALDAYPIQRVW
ncbi:type II toxin-antitoxin system VapC family toxin [Kamptonema formosum]|uniref:type II toxin-antitoxin system VapC family toxin n=1 Tax=Kamptonema formosum TaxID=331992 RepID=UPI00034A0BC3|nr:type II toxin-antitoxin system VapC family toxin [Oscillatoria sp. PCC 10802]